jgi:hypothetical protein
MYPEWQRTLTLLIWIVAVGQLCLLVTLIIVAIDILIRVRRGRSFTDQMRTFAEHLRKARRENRTDGL